MKCNQPITDLSDALDDGMGGAMRLHRACAVEVTPENIINPDYQPAVAKGVWTGGQKPLIHVKGAVGYEGGQAVYEHDLMHKADHPEYGSSQCVLCHRAISGDADVIHSERHVAHRACVETLLAFINEPEPPTAPTKPVSKAVSSKQAVNSASDIETARNVLRWAIQTVAAQDWQ